MSLTIKEEIFSEVILQRWTLLVSVLKQTSSSCWSFCLVSQSRLLPNKMSVIPDNTSLTGCSCHQDDKYDTKVYCGPDICFGFCMTYNNKMGITEYGPCPYIACYNTITYLDGVFYIRMPSNVSLLNEFMCGSLNRKGELCGKCKDGYGIALYSYTLECMSGYCM